MRSADDLYGTPASVSALLADVRAEREGETVPRPRRGPAPTVPNPIRATILLSRTADRVLNERAQATGRSRSQLVDELILQAWPPA